MNLAVLLLACYGLTFAIRTGHLRFFTDPLIKLDFFRKMFQCPLCTGTEVGFVLYIVTYLRPGINWNFLLNGVVFGLAAGAFCYIVEEWIDSLPSSADDD